MTTDSTDTDASRARYKMKKSSCVSDRTGALRGLFVVSMAAAVAVCTTVAFVIIRNLQKQIGVQTYESIAISALASAKAITKRKLQAGRVMETMLSTFFPRASDWPMIDFNGYYLISNEVASMASDENTTMQIGLLVLVEPGEEAFAFEEYAKEYYREQGYPIDAGAIDIGFGIKVRGEHGYVFDRDGNQTTYGSRNEVLVPVLDHSTWNSGMLMYNTHVSSTAVDSVIECTKKYNEEMPPGFSDNSRYGVPCLKPDCDIVSGFRLKGEDLISLIYTPIYPNLNQTTLVGLIGLTVNFNDVIHSVIPDYFDGIYAVISTRSANSNDHSTVKFDTATYEIVQGIPKLIGAGDLHPYAFTHYGKSIVLNNGDTEAADAVVYTLTLYPSSFSQYETTSAAAVAAGLAAVVLVCGISFLLYDSVVRQESNKQRGILKMRRRFVRFISHEIRTPLNTVCMGIDLLLDELKCYHSGNKPATGGSYSRKPSSDVFDEEALEFWQEITRDIKENATGAVGILNDLLNYDKVETNTLHIEAGPVKIIDLVRKTTHRFKVQAVNRKVSLKLQVQDIGSGVMVVGDELRLGEVLSNLISNALKFTPPGGSVDVNVQPCLCCRPQCPAWKELTGCRRVEGSIISERPPIGSVTIKVSDTGPGVKEHQIALLFKEGVQFDANTLQAGGGSGLGLAIAKGIIDRHNGVIRAESRGINRGSTFTVTLPVHGDSHQVSGFGGRLIPNATATQTMDPAGIAQEFCQIEPETTRRGIHSDTMTSHSSVSSLIQVTDQSSPAPVLTPPPGEREFHGEGAEQAPSSQAPSLTPRHESSPVENSTLRTSHKILVAEDVLASRKMLIRLLKRAGHECVVARNGQEAVVEIENEHGRDLEEGHRGIDTILMDYEMPVLNGPDATAEIRRLGYRGLIFGLTGNLLKEDIDYFVIKGADDVFPKPFDITLLDEAWQKFE